MQKFNLVELDSCDFGQSFTPARLMSNCENLFNIEQILNGEIQKTKRVSTTYTSDNVKLGILN